MNEQNNKLVVVTSYPIHSEPVIRNRLSSYFQELSSAGWDVSLVTPESGPEGRTEASVPPGLSEVRYVDPPHYDRSNFWLRGLNEIRLAARLWKAADTIDGRSFMATVPSVFLLLFVKRRKDRLSIIDVRDLVWEYLPDRPLWKKAIKISLRKFALMSLRKADVITISNPSELSYLQSQVPKSLHVLVSNGIGRAQFNALSQTRKRSGNHEVLRVTYIGNVGLAQNLRTLVHAVAGLPKIEVNIIGHGTDYANVEAEISALGAFNIQLHGRVPWEEVITWYEKSDILYAQLSSDYETAMPSKLYEYLATGLPVVYGGCGTAAQILQDFENVDVIQPDSPEELKSVLLQKARQPKMHRSENNIRMIHDNYIRENQVQKLIDTLHMHAVN